MGQGVQRLADLGVIVRGRGEEGQWLVEVRGSLILSAFGPGLEAAADALGSRGSAEGGPPIAGLFLETFDGASSTDCSAVSDFNALLAERERPLCEAIDLLSKLLSEADEEEANATNDVASDSSADGGAEALEQSAECATSLERPQVHEASILPAAGCEEELEAAMNRLVASFVQQAADWGVHPPSSSTAALALRHCQWDDVEVLRRWRDDAATLAEEAGIFCPSVGSDISSAGPTSAGESKPIGWQRGDWRCGICFENFVGTETGLALECGHPFCMACWTQYLATASKGGASGSQHVLDLTCPVPECRLRVGRGVYEQLGLQELAAKFQRALLLSFLECGAVAECPGCQRRVLLGAARPDAGPCRHCARRFCSLCFAEPHGPLTCAEHRTWMKLLVDSQKSRLQKWASRISKYLALDAGQGARKCPNPDCGVMSQKAEGCNFIACPRCKEMWCWGCGDWGGGPSGRPHPHHVFYCTRLPVDPTWLDGHSSLTEDAHFDLHRELWTAREGELMAARARTTVSPHLAQDAATVEAEPSVTSARSGGVATAAEAELASAVVEAFEVLRNGAAWRFFERDDAKRGLFEFAERDLTCLLVAAAPAQTWTGVGGGASERSPASYFSTVGAGNNPGQRTHALAAALRTQIRALRTYRRMGGA